MGVVNWLPLLLLCVAGRAAAESPDSLQTRLDEIVVEAAGGGNVRVSDRGDISVSLRSLQRGVRVMGEADVLAVLKQSGGVSTVGDYGSGLIIQGNAAGQSVYRINRIPVFYPYRFGGIFSTFNPQHFESVTLGRYSRDASAPECLGAVIDLVPSLQFSRPVSLSANVGLLSSSLTAKLSASRRLALTASGRVSYIDALYGHVLKTDKNALSYRFHDVNLSGGWKIDSLNNLTFDFFTNSDRIFAGNGGYAMQTRLDWTNTLGSLRWAFSGEHDASVAVYYSGFSSGLSVLFPEYDVDAQARIHAFGATAQTYLLRARGYLPEVIAGAEMAAYRVTPLHGSLSGGLQRPSAPIVCQAPVGGRIYADAKMLPKESILLEAGLSASCFGRFVSVDPRFAIELRHRGNTWSLALGRFSQLLHNVGFSEIGLASNFWYASTSEIKPQHSLDVIATWNKSLLNGQLTFNLAAYYKYVTSQSEYFGQVLDILNPDFDVEKHILTADGYNTGVEVGVRRNFGALTGGVNYSFGRAMRRSGGMTFRALSDAGHQLKADAEYMFNNHWSVSAAFVYASGRVYTPTKYIYLISGRIITEYGARNSARLPDYQRLDLGATYRFRAGDVSNLVNVSLINAYGHRNVECQYFSLSTRTMRYELIRSSSLYRFLPSISYSIEF